MRALFYVRPWTAEYFAQLGRRAFAQASYASDFPGVGDVDLSRPFYRALAVTDGIDLPPEQVDDIIGRCRVLRNVPTERARGLVAAMANAIEQALDRSGPDVVLSITVDSYVVDLLRVLAERRGIPFFGMSSFLVRGYFLVTARGERNEMREPDPAECEQVLDTLSTEGYLPSYVRSDSSSPSRVVKRWLKEVVKYAYFPAIGVLRNDPWNYHYRASHIVARTRGRPDVLLAGRYEERRWQDALRDSGRPVVYVPLQYHPECNTDYWSAADFSDYEADVPVVLREVARNALVLAKEHPLMFGARPLAFYRELARIPNVVLAPRTVNSRHLIERSDVVLAWSGSVGIEAAAAGRPVVTMGRPYYARGPLFSSIVTRAELAMIPELVRAAAARGRASREVRLEFVRDLLAACLPGFIWSDAWSPAHRTNEELDLTARSLTRYLPAWIEWRRKTSSIVR